MKNVVIECQVFNQVGEKEIVTFSTDNKMKEFLFTIKIINLSVPENNLTSNLQCFN